MRSRMMIKRGLLALGALLIAGLLLVAALPLAASTQIVRDRIAHELGAWSGFRVTMGQAPVISVWPTFRAKLSEVELSEWQAGEGPPVIEADEVTIDLSPLAALRGEVVFSRVSMLRPLMRMRESGTSLQPAASNAGGRLMRSIEAARGVVEADPVNPDTKALPENPFGIVEFTDGRLAVIENGKDEAFLTSLSGRIIWASLNRQAQLSATGIWRGESIAIEVSSSQPLILLAGGEAPMRMMLESAPAALSFEGTANFSEQPFFDGAARFSSPSLRRFLEWSQTEIAAGASIGSITLSGAVAGNHERLKMEDVEIDLSGNQGGGVLDFSVSDGLPTVSGTLAFRTLDLYSFLSTFAPVAGGRGQMHDPVDSELASQINLDLRLSAASAVVSNIEINNVAATVQVKQGLAAFDISDATVFGGTIQAGLRIDRAGEDSTAEIRIHAEGIDAGAFVLASGMKRMVPQARANLSLVAKGAGLDWNAVLANAEGTLTAALGEGTVIGFDLPAFLARSAEGEFFALSDVASGSLVIRGAELKATVQNGLVRIENSAAWADGRTIAIDGIIPYLGRAFALSGNVGPSTDPEMPSSPPEAVFFIGGGWDAPFVSPVLHFGDIQ